MKLPASLSSYNAALTVTLHTSTATLTVLDGARNKAGRNSLSRSDVVLQSAAANAGIEIGLKHIPPAWTPRCGCNWKENCLN